jgi:hypothetical protein
MSSVHNWRAVSGIWSLRVWSGEGTPQRFGGVSGRLGSRDDAI